MPDYAEVLPGWEPTKKQFAGAIECLGYWQTRAANLAEDLQNAQAKVERLEKLITSLKEYLGESNA